MSWSKVKILLIILLAAANMLFAALLIFSEVNMSYIDRDTIENTVSVLAKSNIIIDEGLLSRRKTPRMMSYGKYSEAYYEEVIVSVTGSDNFMTRMTINGISIIMNENDDRFDFFEHFKYIYSKEGSPAESLSLYEKHSDEFAGNNETAEKNIAGKLKEKAEAFFLCEKNDELGYTLENVRIYKDLSSEYYYLYGSQYNNDVRINGNDIYCVFENTELIYSAGVWIFKNLEERYSVDHYDIINLLFIDKAYIDENRKDNSEAYIVEEISMEYGTFWNGAETEYYLVPIWKIKYNNGEERIYNAINGNIYTK